MHEKLKRISPQHFECFHRRRFVYLFGDSCTPCYPSDEELIKLMRSITFLKHPGPTSFVPRDHRDTSVAERYNSYVHGKESDAEVTQDERKSNHDRRVGENRIRSLSIDQQRRLNK